MYLKRTTFVMGLLLFAASSAFIIADAGAAPKDRPVTSGGEGPTGNDWTDYGSPSGATLLYRRSGSEWQAPRLYIRIAETNANFNLTHCRISAPDDVAKVPHLHYDKDYGETFPAPHGYVTATEGKDFFDWRYAGYAPVMYSYGGASGAYNCVCYAYHKTRGDNTLAYYWVNSNDDADKYRLQLFTWADYGDNGDFDTCPGNRCDAEPEHVWIVDASPDACAATTIRWKNNSSGIYRWAHLIYTNDCPKGNPPANSLYPNYAIYDESPP